MTSRRFWLWLAAGLLLFGIGRRFSATGNDFIVYHRAAESLLSGRVDLYSDTFAVAPPMIYVNPPLFILLAFPIGWLSFESAYGVWFALMALSGAYVVRSTIRQWWPQNRARYAWIGVLIVAPYVTLNFRSGNVHFFVVLLTVVAFLAWSRGDLWTAAIALAVGGAIKLFPLFATPILAIRREWVLLGRTLALSAVLWAIPILYFGPQQTVALYGSWYETVVGDIGGYKLQRAVDQSLNGALERWLTHIDYSTYGDREYPPANFADLSKPALKGVTVVVAAAVIGLSLWVSAGLGAAAGERKRTVAILGGIFSTAQLLLGPYSPIQYLSGWVLAMLALPAVLRKGAMEKVLFVLAFVNVLLFAIPGRMSQRVLQAYGAFTIIGLVLWVISMVAARRASIESRR
jgi:hypothetical protein